MSAGAVGSLGSTRLARVDARGHVVVDGSAVTLDWWIGADDRWHRAGHEAAVRQRRLAAAPAYETAMRIPGGDAVERVYAPGVPDHAIIIEIENDSPGPVASALVVAGLRPKSELGALVLPLDGATSLVATRRAAHAVSAADEHALLDALERGEGLDADAPTRSGTGEVVALLQPLAHRTRVRYAVALGSPGSIHVDLVGAPSVDEVAQGWSAMLGRGMRVVLADPGRQLAVDRARADLLLASGSRRADVEVFAALEDWGFDPEANAVWRRLGWWARRRAARRDVAPSAPWATTLRQTRDSLLVEGRDGVIALVPVPPAPGESLEVHDAWTRAGTVSYAVRWHGDRAALLWEMRAVTGVARLSAPGLDPGWSTCEPTGEVLLAPGEVRSAGA